MTVYRQDPATGLRIAPSWACPAPIVSVRRRRPTRGSGREERVIRAQVLERHGGLCAYCGVAPATTVDHILPASRGGPWTAANLEPACGPCNSDKGPLLPAEWLEVRAARGDALPSGSYWSRP